MNKRINNKSLIFFTVVILLIGVFSGCSKPSIENKKEIAAPVVEASFSRITPEEAKKRLDSETDIILLDVRTKEEFAEGHIPNSVLIPVDVLEGEAPQNLKDKETPIFIYCRSGNRSVTAANILIKMGYTNVYDLGGIKNWPYEVVK